MEETEKAIFPADAHIDGLDIKAGKARYQEKMFVEVLRAYCVHTPALLEKLKSPQANTEEYIISVHGLKGSTAGVCADAAAKQAEALEAAGRKGDMEYVTANNDTFIKTIETLLEQLNQLLKTIMEARDAKPSAASPDKEILKKLAEASKQYKVNAMEELQEKLEAFQYESGGDLIEWLREQMDNLEYDEIYTRLQNEITE